MIYFLRGNIFASFTTVSRVSICFQRICNIGNRFSYANSASCVTHVSAVATISICRQAVKSVFSTSFVMFSGDGSPWAFRQRATGANITFYSGPYRSWDTRSSFLFRSKAVYCALCLHLRICSRIPRFFEPLHSTVR